MSHAEQIDVIFESIEDGSHFFLVHSIQCSTFTNQSLAGMCVCVRVYVWTFLILGKHNLRERSAPVIIIQWH